MATRIGSVSPNPVAASQRKRPTSSPDRSARATTAATTMRPHRRSSKRPTRGGRTTASFAATPTAEPGTATPRSASPRRSSSSVGSSTGETDGAPRDAYPLRS